MTQGAPGSVQPGPAPDPLAQVAAAGGQFVDPDRAVWVGLVESRGLPAVLAEVQRQVAAGAVCRARAVAEALEPEAPAATPGGDRLASQVRAWYLAQTGLSQTWVKSEDLLRALRRFGAETVLAMGRDAKKLDDTQEKDHAKVFMFGRKSEYGGWDHYHPQTELSQHLSDADVLAVLAGRVA